MMSKRKFETIFFGITIILSIIAVIYGVWKECLDIEFKRAVISASEEITNE